MDAKKVLQADYLDLIFDNRNKAYGGYELRRNYSRRVKKGVGFMMLGLVAIGSFSFINANRKTDAVKPPVMITTVISELPPNTPPPPKTATPPAAPPPPAKSAIFTPPKIVDASEVKPDETMSEVSKLKDANPGTTNNDSGISGLAPTNAPAGNGSGNSVAVNTTPPSEPPRFVEQMPEFRGNLLAYLANNISYPPAAREAGIQGRVGVEFVVNEDGTITNAHVVRSIGGGCDEEALRVIKAMPKWKPGKNNGIPAKVTYIQSIVFKIE